MKQLNPLSIVLFVVVFGALAVVPQFTNDYIVSLLIGLLMYANLGGVLWHNPACITRDGSFCRGGVLYRRLVFRNTALAAGAFVVGCVRRDPGFVDWFMYLAFVGYVFRHFYFRCGGNDSPTGELV